MFVRLKNRQERLIVLLAAGIVIVGSIIYLVSYQYLFKTTDDASAAAAVWGFDTAGDYTIAESTKVEVASGEAHLIAVDQTDNDNTATGFSGGTHSNTQWDAANSWVELDATGQTSGSGNFTSRIIDAGGSAAWTTLAWTPRYPYFKELPDSVGADSGYATGTLNMTGNLGLWHMNEASWNGAANEVVDSSGSGSNCVRQGSASVTTTGKFSNAGAFDGTTDSLSCGNAASLANLATFTYAAWIKPLDITTNGFSGILGKYDFYNFGGMFVDNTGAFNGYREYLTTSALSASNASVVSVGNWYHTVMTYNESGDRKIHLYLNGAELSYVTQTASVGTMRDDSNLNLTISNATANRTFNGIIDEVAVFNRVLGDDEIMNMYKRGALRLKYQVRSCAQSNCSDGIFIGPDGTTSAYYSETTTSTVGLPSKTLVDIGNNRYFQYKAFYETDNASYTPELSSVAISPTHYPGDSPTVVNKTGMAFAKLTGLTDTVTTGTVTYQVSSNGSTWYYHDGSRWDVASGVSQSNSTTDITKNISTLHQQVGNGSFYFKAFLQSSSSSQYTKLDRVALTYDTTETSEKTITYPKIKSIKIGDGSGVTKTREIPIIIEGDNLLRFKVETDKAKLSDTRQWIRYEGKDAPFVFTLPEGEGIKTLYFRFLSWDGGEINDFAKTVVLNTVAETVCTAPETKWECTIPVRYCVPGKGEESCSIPEWTCTAPASVCNLPKKKDASKDTGGGSTQFTTSTQEAVGPIKVEPIKVEAPSEGELIQQPSSTKKLVQGLDEGDLFMVSSTGKQSSAVYLYQYGRKRPFINDKIFLSWFESFDKAVLKSVTQEEADAIPLGNAVPYKAGSRLVKIKNRPEVYEVMENGRLCHIANEFKAVEKYGFKWNKMVSDISFSSLLNTYHIDPKCEL